jgi:hypothetical protein
MVAEVASFLEDGPTLYWGEAINKDPERLASGVHVDGTDLEPVFWWLPFEIIECFAHGELV